MKEILMPVANSNKTSLDKAAEALLDRLESFEGFGFPAPMAGDWRQNVSPACNELRAILEVTAKPGPNY